MKNLVFTCIVILSLFACSKKDVNKDVEQEENDINQTAILDGLIDNKYALSMNLTCKGNDVNGTYYYVSNGSDAELKLEGTLDENGHLNLIETNSEGKQTGHFDGIYGLKHGYIGTFVNYKGQKMQFNLKIRNVIDNVGEGEDRGFMYDYEGNRIYSSADNDIDEFEDNESKEFMDNESEMTYGEDIESNNERKLNASFSSADQAELENALKIARTYCSFDDEYYERAKNHDTYNIKGFYEYLIDNAKANSVAYGIKSVQDAYDALLTLSNMIIKLGDPEGYVYKGCVYRDKNAHFKDDKKAVECFKKAVQYDVPMGYYHLGLCYENGWGVTTNRRTAADYYHEAFNRGIDEAEKRWLRCYN